VPKEQLQANLPPPSSYRSLHSRPTCPPGSINSRNQFRRYLFGLNGHFSRPWSSTKDRR
jgi:hypothetical protein